MRPAHRLSPHTRREAAQRPLAHGHAVRSCFEAHAHTSTPALERRRPEIQRHAARDGETVGWTDHSGDRIGAAERVVAHDAIAAGAGDASATRALGHEGGSGTTAILVGLSRSFPEARIVWSPPRDATITPPISQQRE